MQQQKLDVGTCVSVFRKRNDMSNLLRYMQMLIVICM